MQGQGGEKPCIKATHRKSKVAGMRKNEEVLQ